MEKTAKNRKKRKIKERRTRRCVNQTRLENALKFFFIKDRKTLRLRVLRFYEYRERISALTDPYL